MQLELFHRWHCPYSQKVRDFVEDNNLRSRINYRELEEDPEAIETLAALTGKQQVPCLVIEGKPLLESQEIINWLDQNLIQGNEARP